MAKNVTLNSKGLIGLWDRQHFGKTADKSADGEFVFSSLFSVYAFSTSRVASGVSFFAQDTSAFLLEAINRDKKRISDKENKLKANSDGVFLMEPSVPYEFEISYPMDRLTLLNGALIKLFAAYNRYFNFIDQLANEGDMLRADAVATKAAEREALNSLLRYFGKACKLFHQVRRSNG